MFSGVGLGEYFAANGLGAGPIVHEISPAMRAAEAQRRQRRMTAALRTFVNPHPGSQYSRSMHGMGEYFAANGLGADDAATVAPDATKYAMWAGGGAVVGLLAATMLKKSKLVGGGIGAVVGAGALYYADQATLT